MFCARFVLPLLATLAANFGCVIPVAPEFEDPEPNFTPELVASNPAVGDRATGNHTFVVQLRDRNLRDTLYVHWIIDYLPYSPNTTRLGLPTIIEPPAGASTLRTPQQFTPSCFNNTIAQGYTQHWVRLVVADRPFKKPEDAPEEPFSTVTTGGNRLEVSWELLLDCN